MGLPGLQVNVQDGNLGLQAPTNSRQMLLMGPCTLGTPNTLYSFNDQTTLVNTLGYGALVDESAIVLAVAGGPVLCMPINPSSQGGVSAVTHGGTGTGTVTLTMAPYAAITITCTTAGTLGNAFFTFQIGSGPVSQPVQSAGSWSSTGFLIPGTYTTWVATAGSYISAVTPDIYVISTLGVITHPQGAGPAIGTQTSSPIDDYQPQINITLGGALGTAQFTYALDQGTYATGTASPNTSAAVITPGGGAYALVTPGGVGTGVVATFAGTFTLNDTYSFTTCGAQFVAGDLTNATNALTSTYLPLNTENMAAVIGKHASTAAWATQAASLETVATTLFNNGVYIRFLNHIPQVGTITASGAAVVVDAADTDSVVASGIANTTAPHVVGCEGDCAMVSPLTSLQQRRGSVFIVAARAAAIEASRNVGDVSLGGLPLVTKLYRDEGTTTALDAVRCTTLRTYPNYSGFYVTDAHTFAATSSDYYPFTNARVVDRMCLIGRAQAMPLVNSKIPIKNDGTGRITEKYAQRIEGKINSAVKAALVDASPQDLVAFASQVNRANNIAVSSNVIIALTGVAFAYGRTVTLNVGLALSTNPGPVVSA